MTVLRSKFSHHFGELQRIIILIKFHQKKKIVKKCTKKVNYFKVCIKPEKILPKKNWFKDFEKIWSPEEETASKVLQNFIKDKLENYSEGRNLPNKIGTSKLSPFIKFGQIHVQTIWEECVKKKTKNYWDLKISC